MNNESPTVRAIAALAQTGRRVQSDKRSPSGWRLDGRVVPVRAMIEEANAALRKAEMPVIEFPGVQVQTAAP
ncbi:hypothetical protein [Pararhodospirillum photometricum]|uniref:hypothetical protein n=1 Tax=Pararhodospirillum photometricum TaxID=1084 RepID=UPI0002DB954D|nr:hypothetical protein [Pararhodospirillum photometricum]